MNLKETLTVTTDELDQRMDSFLASKFPQFSRTQWQKIIENKSVKINGKTIGSVSRNTKAGDRINIDFTEPKRNTTQIDVLFESDNLLVINKQTHVLVSDETFLSRQPTVIDSLRRKYKKEAHIVHRLDKETSGVLLVAKNEKAKEYLQDQFRQRTIKKHYLALVDGRPKYSEAKLNWPIKRDPAHPIKWLVAKNGRNSITSYNTKKEFTHKTLLNVYPKTGRTHQIRVHLAHLGTPVACDGLYGKKCNNLNRQFLHAQAIVLKMPFSENEERFTAPLPDELEQYLDTLQ